MTVSKLTGIKRNKIVTEALETWIKTHNAQSWPEEFINFNGIDDIENDIFRLENDRDNLIPPKESTF